MRLRNLAFFALCAIGAGERGLSGAKESFVISTVDGAVQTIDAWTGELRGVFGSGGPLTRPSASFGRGDKASMVVVPGSDGSLWWLPPAPADGAESGAGGAAHAAVPYRLPLNALEVTDEPRTLCSAAPDSANPSDEGESGQGGSEGEGGQDAESKKRLKRAANRKSAQLSRMRKKKYIEDLTSQYSKLKRSAEILAFISDVVFMLDEAGTIVFVSEAVRRVLHLDADSLKGRSIYAIMTLDSARRLQDMLAATVAGHEKASRAAARAQAHSPPALAAAGMPAAGMGHSMTGNGMLSSGPWMKAVGGALTGVSPGHAYGSVIAPGEPVHHAELPLHLHLEQPHHPPPPPHLAWAGIPPSGLPQRPEAQMAGQMGHLPLGHGHLVGAHHSGGGLGGMLPPGHRPGMPPPLTQRGGHLGHPLAQAQANPHQPHGPSNPGYLGHAGAPLAPPPGSGMQGSMPGGDGFPVDSAGELTGPSGSLQVTYPLERVLMGFTRSDGVGVSLELSGTAATVEGSPLGPESRLQFVIAARPRAIHSTPGTSSVGSGSSSQFPASDSDSSLGSSSRGQPGSSVGSSSGRSGAGDGMRASSSGGSGSSGPGSNCGSSDPGSASGENSGSDDGAQDDGQQ